MAKNERPTNRRSHLNLSRGINRPVNQRKLRDGPVLPELRVCQYRITDGDEMNCRDYPADSYSTGYMT